MKLKTRFLIVVLVVVMGFAGIAAQSTFFVYKINRLKRADAICVETLNALKLLRLINAELLYSVELDKTWSNWKTYHEEFQNSFEVLHSSPYIHELMVTQRQKGLLQSLHNFWLSTSEKLTLVEKSMDRLFLMKNLSRNGLIQQYYTTKNYEILNIRNHVMDVSLYLRSEFEIKLTKLISRIEDETDRRYFNALLLVAFVSSALALTVSAILFSFLTKLQRYLAELHDSMEIIGKGNFTEKLSVEGNDELSQISMAINTTTDNLGKTHLELEERIREQSLAKEEAESANRSKSIFLANMSHELRTPLNAILGFSRIISRGENLDVEQRENLSIISRSGGHLLSLINDILTMSKIEAGQTILNEQPVDLYYLLDDLKDMFRLKADQKELDFFLIYDGDIPRFVQVDEVKLRQILINLIQNGLKFTWKGSVTLSVSRQETNLTNPSSQVIRFEVRDTGIGLDKSEYAAIFEAFVQTDLSRERQEGTGLGLSISRRFVKLMQGELVVDSVKGKGSKFIFDIPLKVVRTVVGQTPGIGHDMKKNAVVVGVEQGQPEVRILIVDDKWDNRRLLVTLLEPLGFKLEEARDGEEAVRMWKHFQPHLVFMDIRMPVMDGKEATLRIKKEDRKGQTVIVAVTASVFEEEKESIFSSGCTEVLTKPFESYEIYGQIENHLGIRFIYEGQKEHEDDPLIIQGEDDLFIGVPGQILKDLEQVVMRAEMDKISLLIKEIKKYNPSLASAVSQLANAFAYDKISRLLSKRPRIQS